MADAWQQSDFSSAIAHDIRTPINNLLGQTQVALGRPRSGDELREVLESNVEDFERMARMADDMLLLAQADNAQEVLQPSTFDLRSEVQKILTYFEPLTEERAIRARVEGDAILKADRTMIQRMLGNLLSNALRHSPQGGAILVRIRSNSDESLELAVANAGEPISAEHLPRLFDRLYRADAARSSSGAGLGLAIVKSIAELHRGRASVTCTATGETRFAVHLPPLPATGSAAPNAGGTP